MNIGIVTTWPPKQCGIAEYSANLVYCLDKFSPTTIFTWDILPIRQEIVASDCEIVHFQNQGSFWSGEWFEETLRQCKEAGKRTVVTFHDSAIWPGFNGWQYIDLAIAHKKEILADMPIVHHTAVMPMPVIEIPLHFCGYGLGRSDHEAIKMLCEKNGCKYSYLDPKKGWLSQEQLINWVKEHDGVILWYSEVNISGCSSGARLAMAAKRPLFINDIEWFNDLDSDIHFGVTKFKTIEDLSDWIKSAKENMDGMMFYYRNAAEMHHDLYKKLTEGEL